MPDVENYDTPDERPFYHQYYARFETPEQALAAAETVNRLYGDRVTAFVNGEHVNIGRKGSSKTQGVFAALAYFGLPLDAAAVFGDDYNDLDMILASKAGFLFRSTEQIKKDHPELPACETYDDLLALIRSAL